MSTTAASVMCGVCMFVFACKEQAREAPVFVPAEASSVSSLTDASSSADASDGPLDAAVSYVNRDEASIKRNDAGPALGTVRVTNIGMHIGGSLEINTDENKAPIEQSAKRSFGAFSECAFSNNIDLPMEYGIDLLIDAKGGPPTKVDNARTQSKNETFRRCMLEAFQRTDFLPPRTGRTRVSYSLRLSR